MHPLLKQRYQILRDLSSVGGFGQTFLAEDTHVPSRRRCVIKKLKPVADPDHWRFVRERFEREAAILERLGESSDQIPKLYAYFPEGEEFYLVQELVEGPTLRQKVQRDGTLTEEAVGALLVRLLDVMTYVHGQGIIHRDIKPDNVILRERDNTPVLIDFGVVKEVLRLDADGAPTHSVAIGTPGYVSPEQAVGSPVFASDLYSLGATAVFLLTKKNPQQMSDPVTGEIRWRPHAPAVSAGSAAVLDKALAPLASDRYRTADEMRREVQAWFGGGAAHVSEPLPPTEVDTLRDPQADELLIPYQKGGRWGFCDRDRRVVIPPKYDGAWLFKDGVARVKLGGRYGFVDRTGRELTPFKYDQAEDFRSGVAQVVVARGKHRANLRVGYVDATGAEVIPLKYPYPPYTYFSEGLIDMQFDGRWGFLDAAGRVVIPFKYDDAKPFREGLAAVEIGGRWGFINRQAEEVIPLKFYGASPFSEGLANVRKGSVAGLVKQWGFIDQAGNEVIPFERDFQAQVYNNAAFSDGLACVIREGLFGFINHAGEVVIPFRRYSEVSPFIKGQDVAYVSVDDGDRYGFIDKTGYPTVEIKYTETSHALAVFDVVGGIVIPGRSMFHDGLARVNVNDRWGYIDRTDYEAIPLKYLDARPFSEGLASVSRDKYRYGYIDTTGKEVLPFQYGSSESFHEGLALVRRPDSLPFYIDREGTEYRDS